MTWNREETYTLAHFRKQKLITEVAFQSIFVTHYRSKHIYLPYYMPHARAASGVFRTRMNEGIMGGGRELNQERREEEHACGHIRT